MHHQGESPLSQGYSKGGQVAMATVVPGELFLEAELFFIIEKRILGILVGNPCIYGVGVAF